MRIAFLVLGTLLAAMARAETIEMKVNGLVCGFCAQGIEKTLRRNPATEDVVVSLEEHLVALSTHEGQDIPDNALREALTSAGYDVKAISRTNTPIEQIRARVAGAER